MANILNAQFLKHGPRAPLRKFTVRQKYGNHTLAWLDYDITEKAQYLMPPEQSPLQVTWGQSPLGVRSYYGYANHYETVASGEDNSVFTRLWSLGTSRVMNSATPSNWAGMTRSGIARDLAKRHKLRSIVHEHPYPVDNWASGNRSDFQVLKALADESGYRAWVDGSTLYFLDPQRLLTSAQTFDTPSFSREQIRSFKVTGGAGAPRDGSEARRRVVFGLDYTTNEFFEATGGNPQFATEVVNQSVTTYTEADMLASAHERADDEYYTARLTVDGNASVYPGALVRLQGNDVAGDRGGFWIVTEASHEVTEDDFTTKFEATRGVSGSPVILSATTLRGARQVDAATVRDGGTWEALLQEHVYA